MTQELLALRDELKGMFDDRKMDVRMEQRAMESKVRGFPLDIILLTLV
jgi:PleD family two-component response regulator